MYQSVLSSTSLKNHQSLKTGRKRSCHSFVSRRPTPWWRFHFHCVLAVVEDDSFVLPFLTTFPFVTHLGYLRCSKKITFHVFSDNHFIAKPGIQSSLLSCFINGNRFLSSHSVSACQVPGTEEWFFVWCQRTIFKIDNKNLHQDWGGQTRSNHPVNIVVNFSDSD